MEIADQAEATEELHRTNAIRNARNNKSSSLQHVGHCHHCGNEIESPKLFCDGHCATRFEKRKGS